MGPLTGVEGAEPLPLPNPQAGHTGEAPGATSITVAQRGHFRRGKGRHHGSWDDRPPIPPLVLKPLLAAAAQGLGSFGRARARSAANDRQQAA